MSDTSVAFGILGMISVVNCLLLGCGVRSYRRLARKLWALEHRFDEQQQQRQMPTYTQPVFVQPSAPSGYQYVG